MALEQMGESITLIAAADLSAKQFHGVVVDTAGKAALSADSADRCVGILQDKPTSGQAGQVQTTGVSKAVAGGTVTAGDRIQLKEDEGAKGRVITLTDNDALPFGIALSAGTDGQLISLLLLA